MFIVRRWGFGDASLGGFWDTPRFGDIPLGPIKLSSPSFLGFVTSGLLNLSKGDFFFLSRVLSPSLLENPQADPFLLFVCL